MAIEFEDEATFKRGFQKRLKETRLELEKSQDEMAEFLGCSKAMYPKYEKRDHYPLHLLPKLIVKTEKPASYWIFGEPSVGSKVVDRVKRKLRVIK